MGRFLAAVACVMVCIVAPDSWAGDINPTRWPKDQWRSGTFDSYSQYPRHRRVHIIKQVIRIKVEPASPRIVFPARVPPRPLVIRNGAAMNAASAAGAPAQRSPCNGVLVLTWEGDHARASCHRGR